MSYTTVRVECPCGWNAEISGTWMIAYEAKQLLEQHYKACEQAVEEGTE